MSQKIIMIHGFRGTHHGLALIAKNLPSYESIIPDLPGFGEGDTLNSYDLASYVEWLHGYIKLLGLVEKPILLGHSFGSIICAAYAAKYPETFDKLILVNPIGAPALEGPRGALTKLAQFYYWLGDVLPDKAARAWLAAKPVVYIMSTTMAKTRDRELRRWIHNQHFTYFSRFHNTKSIMEAFNTSVTHNVRESAPFVTSKTLLIAGDKDDITPLAKQQELLKMFPHAELKVIKGVGHLTHYETPDQVAALVQAFIKSV